MPTADKVNIPTFVTNLECSMTGETFEADRIHGLVGSRVGAVAH